MPAATTHVEFARDVYQSIPVSLRDQITDLPMYYLGSQGPDLFFFHRYSVLPGSLRRLGTMMHEENVQESLLFLREHCSQDAHLYSYYLGFLTHYALDSRCHPLIEWYAERRHQNENVPEGEAHFTYEGNLDAYMLRYRKHAYSVWKDLTVDRENAQRLGQLFHSLFASVYQIDVPVSKLAQAPLDCGVETRLLRPEDTKYKVVTTLEKLVHAPKMLSGMMLCDKDPDTEVLNLDHKVYQVPGHPDTSNCRSFPELYGDAGILAFQLMRRFDLNFVTRDFIGCHLNKETI